MSLKSPNVDEILGRKSHFCRSSHACDNVKIEIATRLTSHF